MTATGLRNAGMTLKELVSTKKARAALIIALLIPAIGGLFYLAAFADPSGGMSNVSVAVVNLDEGTTIDGKNVNYGDDVVDALSGRSDSMDWHFVSAEDAQAGLEDGTYYMVCTIPEDFSSKVASSLTDDPHQAKLGITYDQSRGLAGTSMGQEIFDSVEAQVNSVISEDLWSRVLDQVDDAGSSLNQGASSVDQLTSGADALTQGADAFTEGLGTLDEGMSALAEGGTTLSEGTSQLSAITEVLAEQTSDTSALYQASSAVATSLSTLSDTVDEQLPGLVTSVNEAYTTVQTALDGDGTAQNPGLVTTSQQTVDEVTALQQGLADAQQQASDQASSLQDNVDATQQTAEDLATRASEASQAYQDATTDAEREAAAEQMQQVLDEVSTQLTVTDTTSGSSSSSAGSGSTTTPTLADQWVSTGTQAVTALNQVSSALGTDGTISQTLTALQYQTSAVNASLQQVDSLVNSDQTTQAFEQFNAYADSETGIPAQLELLATAASGVQTGVAALGEGTDALNQGVDALASGMDGYTQGVSAVADATPQLVEGSQTLADGLSALRDGSQSIYEELDSASSGLTLPDSVKSDRAETSSDPVGANEDYYTTVKSNAADQAPFAVAAGLWLGLTVFSFIAPAFSRRLALSSARPVSTAFSGYVPFAAVGVVMAVLLDVVLALMGLQAQSWAVLVGMSLLCALSFAAIVQLLSAAFGRAGQLLSAVLLAVQVACCGALFPIETAPGIIQALSDVMPMTYAVEGMRQIMTGTGYSVAGPDALVIAIGGLVAFALTAWVVGRKDTVRLADLKPATV